MGPLIVNEIITENANFLLAFFIGIAFGLVLESAGFSSSRKLAGVFYGYDTVVLKVFFTGAITAAGLRKDERAIRRARFPALFQ